ncbi:MAG: hydroxylamine reductase [Chitinivibrionales bacterium]|nr:hydroxylamine reductase [Chitinivibrionales bacterium]
MFCYQCEQTAKGTGCEAKGVCGKSPEVAALQDLMVFQLKGIGYFAHEARMGKLVDETVDRFVLDALFTTVTNVNFDEETCAEIVRQGVGVRQRAFGLFRQAAMAQGHEISDDRFPEAAAFEFAESTSDLIAQGAARGILADSVDADVRSLQQLLTYGLKGMAAYAHHAHVLGKSDETIFAFFLEALHSLTRQNITVEELVELTMRCGKVNIRTMELLDEGHTGRFGHPQPTPVPTGTRAGPAIIVTGHDLLDLENLLKQTEGTGVSIYTHSEMLPAHGYPELKKYPHLAGHFGTAWQNQQKEFDGVPAAFLFTTNCIQKPLDSYKDNVFTTGLVQWPDVKHVGNNDFSAVIAKAKELGGFGEHPGGQLLTGFGRNAVMNVADKVVDAVKRGAIRHFFLVGGCDGAKPGRNYYTDLVENTPSDTVILTLACGKFRINHLELGDIGGIPRLLDVGQCNDAYSAVKIAQALAEAFDCGINDLPLSLILSWYEQKAVVILLSLLSIGVKGIRLGPTLPAFISPNILNFLVEKFDIKPITSAEEDLQAILH